MREALAEAQSRLAILRSGYAYNANYYPVDDYGLYYVVFSPDFDRRLDSRQLSVSDCFAREPEEIPTDPGCLEKTERPKMPRISIRMLSRQTDDSFQRFAVLATGHAGGDARQGRADEPTRAELHRRQPVCHCTPGIHHSNGYPADDGPACGSRIRRPPRRERPGITHPGGGSSVHRNPLLWRPPWRSPVSRLEPGRRPTSQQVSCARRSGIPA